MKHAGKNYSVEYDEKILRLEAVKTFEDEVVIVLRKKTNAE